jgi:hypothetical protein
MQKYINHLFCIFSLLQTFFLTSCHDIPGSQKEISPVFMATKKLPYWSLPSAINTYRTAPQPNLLNGSWVTSRFIFLEDGNYVVC